MYAICIFVNRIITSNHPITFLFISMSYSPIRCLMMLMLFCSLSFISTAQYQVIGQLIKDSDELPLARNDIRLEQYGLQTTTDADGRFSFAMQEVIDGSIHLDILGYESIDLLPGRRGDIWDLGTIYVVESLDEILNVPTIVLNEQTGDDGTEDVSGLLSASQDPFAEIASFDLSWGRFRMRGLNTEHQTMMINGIPTNDLETGRVLWNTWGGLNDAVRTRHDALNLNASDFAYGGLLGSGYIDIRPSAMRKRTRISYAMSNGNYRHRLMGFYNSGLNEKGWGLAISASKRYAEEGYVEGTNYDGYSYFISLEKKINQRHSLNLASFGAYIKRGRSSAAVQEAYDINELATGDLIYNPNWGYQAGEKRNARVRTTFQPMVVLNHDWRINEKLKISTGASYRFGRFGDTALDWNTASDPRPDYYRYLPSWEQTPDQREAVRQSWIDNVNVRQIDWDRMIRINSRVSETIYNVDGIEGNDLTGRRSRYIVEERRYDPQVLSLNTNLQAALSNAWSIVGGLNYTKQVTDNYKLVDDLLGGEFYFDVDKFAESDFADPNKPAPAIIQSNLLTPNRVVKEGDEFGYHYEIHSQLYTGWLQAKYRGTHWELFAGTQLGQSSFWRNGIYQNGIHANNSLGESERNTDFLYGVKGGITYKLNGRNYITLNGSTGQNGAIAREGFRSERVSNQMNPYNKPWTYTAYDLTYDLRTPFVKARLSVFRNQIEDLTESISFYNDFRNTFGNYLLGNIDYVTEGIEGGVAIKVTPTIELNGGFSLTDNHYTDRAISSIIDDRAQEYFYQDEIVYNRNFKLDGIPNTAINVGIEYNSPKYWWIGASANYFDDIYIDYSPFRRRTEAVELLDPDSDIYHTILNQESVGEHLIFHLKGGYSYRIKYGKYIRLFFLVNNILDTKDYISGGFEQLRFDTSTRDPNTFPSKYYYNYGRSFFVSLTLDL